MEIFSNAIKIWLLNRKYPHTGDNESLDGCGQQRQYQKNPASKGKFVDKTVWTFDFGKWGQKDG